MTFAKIVSCIGDTLKYILHACMMGDSSLQRRRDLTVTRITKKVLVHRLRNNSKIFENISCDWCTCVWIALTAEEDDAQVVWACMISQALCLYRHCLVVSCTIGCSIMLWPEALSWNKFRCSIQLSFGPSEFPTQINPLQLEVLSPFPCWIPWPLVWAWFSTPNMDKML
jgi:hypothetical protein